MKRYIMSAIIYVGFYIVVGIAVWVTKSAIPLVALIFTPDIEIGEGEK